MSVIEVKAVVTNFLLAYSISSILVKAN